MMFEHLELSLLRRKHHPFFVYYVFRLWALRHVLLFNLLS